AETVGLQERVDLAVAKHADILISVHNNSLPDGQDPWKELGTSSYWYHPQAVELAKALRKNTQKGIGFPDYGTRFQNLALCRPSEMPACLVEVGFMIHPDEYSTLLSDAGQENAAQGLVAGLEEYLAGPQ